MKNLKYIWTLTAILLTVAVLLCACSQNEAELSQPELAETGLSEVYITELMASNKSSLADESGQFPDWLELYNAQSESVDISGFVLTNGKDSWTIPEMSLEPGEYKVFFCDKNGNEACVGFNLSSTGGTITLLDASGAQLDKQSYGQAEADESYLRGKDGQMQQGSYCTPGYENSDTGYAAFQEASPLPELLINEVMAFNRQYESADGEFYDRIELKNNSQVNLELSQYYLSDSGSERLAYRLPEYSLAPGELYVLICDDSVPFSLSSEQDQLFLSCEDGRLVDYACVRNIPWAGSYGRMPSEGGYFYFQTNSIGLENSDGARLISQKPVSVLPDGVFDDVDTVTAQLSGQGSIYYTLDGSTPTEQSQLYTGQLSFSENTVLRAVCVEEGKLPSQSLDLSYIINQQHTLPVASLVIDPNYMFGSKGLYSNPGMEWERPGSLSLYDGEETFNIACGVQLHGETSRYAQEKKSMKLTFRGAYEGQLEYDLFQNGVEEFSSILLRAAQESSFSTHMRDIVMHELAQQCQPELSTQDYKYSVLYINGEYWGIYALREAHSAEHFANHNGYDPKLVSMWKGRWGYDSDFESVYSFVLNNDMSKDENYRQVIDHIDLDSLIAWSVVESYSGNIDINSPNVRFYYSAEDQKLHYALVDLDLGLFAQGQFSQSIVTGYAFNRLILALLDNEEFKALMLSRTGEYLAGPLSEENVRAVIGSLADELRPEIARDGEKWGYTLAQWEREIENYLYGVVGDYGAGEYCSKFARSAKSLIYISGEDFEKYFGALQ